MKKPSYAALAKLLDEAGRALADELHAAGEDEVRSHPTLRAHDRLLKRIRRTLDAVSTGE